MTAPIDPFSEARLGPLTLRNRILKAATFEGRTGGNRVSPELIEFHRRIAAGGVGMTTVAYLAVSADGRGAPNELVPEAQHEKDLQQLADAVHAEGAALSGTNRTRGGRRGERRAHRSLTVSFF